MAQLYYLSNVMLLQIQPMTHHNDFLLKNLNLDATMNNDDVTMDICAVTHQLFQKHKLLSHPETKEKLLI